jgi:cytochrome P450
MMHLTLRIVGLLLFSQELSATRHSVGTALDELQVQMGERFSSLVPLPPVLPTPRDKRFRQARDRLSRLGLGIVAERRRDPNPPADLLTSLLEACDPETGESMTDQQICAELITFLLAGHETTANTLTWAFYLLSAYPETRRRLEAELATETAPVRGLCDRVILEALRLYPPGWVFGRRSYGPDQFRGFDIGPNQIVTISPYILHRHPEFWPNPEGFDPDRFLAEIPRGAFVPFAAGPRQCIGNHFALLESRLILSTIVKQVRLNMTPGTRPVLEPMVTLRPRGGLPITLEFGPNFLTDL